jgi:uncharacterized membrane protein YoaK (UPF0700 family)
LPEAIVLAVIAGYADAAGFLRFDAFAGMMTGNTVLMGVAAVRHLPAASAGYAALIAIFFAGALTARGLVQLGRTANFVFAIEAVLLLVTDAFRSHWAIVPLVIAMGLQSTAMTQFHGVRLNTVFITGNLQRFAEGLAGRYGPRKKGTPTPVEGRGKIAIFGWVWLGYAIGASLGAAGGAFLGYPLLVPVALLGFVAWQNRRGEGNA